MADFASFITMIGQFNTGVVLPFIVDFFTSTIGFTFVAVSILCVIFAGLINLLKNKI